MGRSRWGKYTSSDPQKFSCVICGHMVRGQIGLRLHSKMSHGGIGIRARVADADEPRSCIVCGKVFENDAAMGAHCIRHGHIR